MGYALIWVTSTAIDIFITLYLTKFDLFFHTIGMRCTRQVILLTELM